MTFQSYRQNTQHTTTAV